MVAETMPNQILLFEVASYVALGLVAWRAIAAPGTLWRAQRSVVSIGMAIALLLEVWNEKVMQAACYPVSIARLPGTAIPLAVLCVAGLYAAATFALATTAARQVCSIGALRWLVFAVVLLGAVFQAHSVEVVFQSLGYWEILPRFETAAGLGGDAVAVVYVAGVSVFYAAFLLPACLAGLALHRGIAKPPATLPGGVGAGVAGAASGSTAKAARRGSAGRYLSALRSGEVVLMSGFAVAGLVFAIDRPAPAIAVPAGLFTAAILMLFSSIYLFNAWSSREADGRNPRLATLALLSGRTQSLLIVAFGGGGFLALAALGPWQIIAGAASCVLWVAYSWPRIGLKGVPFAGTAVHFVTQSLFFLMLEFPISPLVS